MKIKQITTILNDSIIARKMVEKTITDLPLDDLLHLLTFLKCRDVIHLRISCPQLLRTVPSPKERRLLVDFASKEDECRKDLEFLLGSDINIHLTIPVLTSPTNFSDLDKDVQRLVLNSPERVKSIAVKGHDWRKQVNNPDPIYNLRETFTMYKFRRKNFPCLCRNKSKCYGLNGLGGEDGFGTGCRRHSFYITWIKDIPIKFQYNSFDIKCGPNIRKYIFY